MCMQVPGKPVGDRDRRVGRSEDGSMSEEFIGRGWAFPLRTDATGGIALVSREREVEEAIRLILGTTPGERPMRPEFGCRIHDFVFASADGDDRRRDHRRGDRALAPLGAADRRRGRRSSAIDALDQSAPVHRHPLQPPADERPAQPRLPVLRDPGRVGAGMSHPPVTGPTKRSALTWPSPSRTSTIAASRTSSTTPSAWSSSAARSGRTTTSPTRA